MQLSKKTFFSFLQPAPAWIAILGLIILIFLALVVKAGLIAWLIYYLGSFIVGIFLYQRYPLLYVGFTWWLCFLGPFIKRLIDYRSGYQTPGAWTLVPLLVASISFATFIRYFPRVNKQGGFPFILGVFSIFYGVTIQLINQPLRIGVITIFLTWLAPILFGFHLFVNWRDYPDYRQNMQRVFLWGVIFMGLYGIWQFFILPPWDQVWIENPLTCPCFEDRLWSTMLSPFTFSAFMMAGLMLLFANQTILKFPATIVGYLSFLLTLSRSAWLSWILSFLFLFASFKSKFQQRLIIGITVMIIVVLPLSKLEVFSEAISSRMTSFSNIESDNSYQARLEGFQNFTDDALVEFIGKGLSPTVTAKENNGNTENFSGSDGGLLWVLFSLGWFGTIPFLSGIALLIFQSFQNRNNHLDIFAITVRSIAVSIFCLASIGFPGIFGADGMILVWGFLGIVIASHKYHCSKFFARATVSSNLQI
jgi:hypothetical protein